MKTGVRTLPRTMRRGLSIFCLRCRPNPLERLTAEEALTHPWLASEDRRATREGDAKERALASQL